MQKMIVLCTVNAQISKRGCLNIVDNNAVGLLVRWMSSHGVVSSLKACSKIILRHLGLVPEIKFH